MNAERAIHAAVFALLLVGLCTVSGWVSYQYVNDIILKLAAMTLSWGIILLVLYIGFRKVDWRWWN